MFQLLHANRLIGGWIFTDYIGIPKLMTADSRDRGYIPPQWCTGVYMSLVTLQHDSDYSNEVTEFITKDHTAQLHLTMTVYAAQSFKRLFRVHPHETEGYDNNR